MERRSARQQCRMLCIQGTGSGKSLLYQTLAAHFVGVTIYVSPLLTLGADQVNKLMQRTSVPGYKVIPLQLDAVKTAEQLKHLLALVEGLQDSISLVVFTSPQTVTDRFPKFIESVKSKVSFVVIDEIHLFNYFGRTFRHEFQKLKTKMFRKLSATVPMLFLTASCNPRIRRSFETMIGVDITHSEWPSALEISNRRVSLYCDYSQKPLRRVMNDISGVLKVGDRQSDKVIVYSNVRNRVIDVQEKLGDLFDRDDNLHKFEVLAIHGQLTKEEKSSYIQMFLDPQHPDDANIKVMCATSGVGNVGIDSPNIRSVFRLEMPPSLIDFVQESGRAGRVQTPDPLNFSYHVHFSIENFLYLYERAMDPEAIRIDNEFCSEEVDSLFEMARLLVLREECFYVAIETRFGNPDVQALGGGLDPCDNLCPYCRDKEKRVIPIIDRVGTQRVIFHIFNPLPTNANVNTLQKPWTLEVLVNSIRSFPDATMLILKSRVKGGISPDTIKRVIFCLLLKGMLKLNFNKDENRAVFSLAHSNSALGEFALMEPQYWTGVELK